MITEIESFDVTGIPQRSALLSVQLLALYIVAQYSKILGVLAVPILLLSLFLAVYFVLKQVEGVVEETVTQ